jgi:hypothetical protein
MEHMVQEVELANMTRLITADPVSNSSLTQADLIEIYSSALPASPAIAVRYGRLLSRVSLADGF